MKFENTVGLRILNRGELDGLNSYFSRYILTQPIPKFCLKYLEMLSVESNLLLKDFK